MNRVEHQKVIQTAELSLVEFMVFNSVSGGCKSRSSTYHHTLRSECGFRGGGAVSRGAVLGASAFVKKKNWVRVRFKKLRRVRVRLRLRYRTNYSVGVRVRLQVTEQNS